MHILLFFPPHLSPPKPPICVIDHMLNNTAPLFVIAITCGVRSTFSFFQLCLMDLHSSDVCSVLLLTRPRICFIMIQNTNAFLMLVSRRVHCGPPPSPTPTLWNMFTLPFNCAHSRGIRVTAPLLHPCEANRMNRMCRKHLPVSSPLRDLNGSQPLILRLET